MFRKVMKKHYLKSINKINIFYRVFRLEITRTSITDAVFIQKIKKSFLNNLKFVLLFKEFLIRTNSRHKVPNLKGHVVISSIF